MSKTNIATINKQSGNALASLAPTDLKEAMEFAKLLSQSTIVPKDYVNNPGNILVAVQWGMELGLPPLQAMQNIAVINGRPSVWGDALLALVRASGLLEYIRETNDGKEASCEVKRIGEEATVRTFSLDDAKQAGLLSKQGPWQQYPKRMLQMRARAFALRDTFTDVLKGMHVREEIEDESHTVSASVVDKSATRTEQVKQLLAPEEAVDKETGEIKDMSSVLADDINAAGTSAALELIAKKIASMNGGISADKKKELRKLYRDKKKAIEDAAAPLPAIPERLLDTWTALQDELKTEGETSARDYIAAMPEADQQILQPHFDALEIK